MGLINYTNLEDNTSADANKFNERFGAIVDEVNGNLDSQNLKNGAVTREKIAAGAVTSDKLAISRTVDERGWTVEDYGAFKRYTKIVEHTAPNFTITPGEVDYTMWEIDGPVGVIAAANQVNITKVLLWGATSWTFIYKGDQYSVNGTNGKITLSGHIQNTSGSNQGIWFKYQVEVVI